MLSDKPFGRPTKYRPEYCQQLLDYFTLDPYKQLVDEDNNPTGLPPKFPTIERFSESIGVVKNTVYDWAKKHTDFSDALKRARDKQKAFLTEAAMAGIYDRTFILFASKNLINWSDHGCTDSIPDLSKIKTFKGKIKRINKALTDGDITLVQAKMLADIVKDEIAIVEATEFEERLTRIESSLNASSTDKAS